LREKTNVAVSDGENPWLARLRDGALRFYSVRSLIRNIVAALDSPI